jgi:hypothetical protein
MSLIPYLNLVKQSYECNENIICSEQVQCLIKTTQEKNCLETIFVFRGTDCFRDVFDDLDIDSDTFGSQCVAHAQESKIIP